MYRIPGFHVRHNQDGVEFACSKDKEDLGGVPTVIRGRAGDSQHPSRLIGKMNAMNSVIPPAPLFYGNLQMDLVEEWTRTTRQFSIYLLPAGKN